MKTKESANDHRSTLADFAWQSRHAAIINSSRTSSVSRLRSAPASTSWSRSSPRTDSHSDHIVRIVSVMNRQSSSLSGGGWLGLRIFGAELAASFCAAFAEEVTRQEVYM